MVFSASRVDYVHEVQFSMAVSSLNLQASHAKDNNFCHNMGEETEKMILH